MSKVVEKGEIKKIFKRYKKYLKNILKKSKKYFKNVLTSKKWCSIIQNVPLKKGTKKYIEK